MNDLISRKAAFEALCNATFGCADIDVCKKGDRYCAEGAKLDEVPSAQPEEVIPHRNYKYLSDYWCACGWHLGKKGEVKYCADCGRKVNWDG